MTSEGHAKSEQTPPARQSVNGWDAAFVDSMYAAWQADPASVDPQWRQFFAGFDLGIARPAVPAAAETAPTATADAGAGIPSAQRQVDLLITRYREFGHRAAHLDPLGSTRPFPEALTLESVGLGDEHLGQLFDAGSLPIASPAPLGEIVGLLERIYCADIGAEFAHITDLSARHWLERRIEQDRARPIISVDQQRRIFAKLVDSDAFESFLAMRYVGKKRFGLEGADTIIPMLDAGIESAAALGAREFCFAFAHRGRVNLLVNVVGKRYEQALTEFDESWTQSFANGGGDVKYHQGHSSTLATASGAVRLTASANASHLEFVNSIVLGRARAKQDLRNDQERTEVVPILVHGDSSFPGQGSVAECLNFMRLPGYEVGGALHVIINNQVGFTTNPEDTFGGEYCSDLAKAFDVPVFHVNGDDPEACVWAMQTAAEFRQAFHRDALVELWCYRKNGHNETDEPAFTQPLLYRRVKSHAGVAANYRDRLIAAGTLTRDEADAMVKSVHDRMDAAQTAIKVKPVCPLVPAYEGRWTGLSSQYSGASVETGVSLATLTRIASALAVIPDHITPHKTIARLLSARGHFDTDAKVDWAQAELLAFGSLLVEGHSVRLSGLDVERGTFSHRHAVITCQDTGAKHSPLQALGKFRVWNSPLTEGSIVGFELGYALTDPSALVIWEAQFGDFANGAQVIFDQFMASGEIKWGRSNGLVLFLPHGYEGQGPEHSSARVERFLQLAAQDNMEVAAPSTTAQIFHVLRRHLHRPFRKPLVLLSPKSMLRLPDAQSPGSAFVQGSFARVIDDPATDRMGTVTRLFFCSGKYFHELNAKRAEHAATGCAFVRIEQLAPFPADEVEAILKKYRGAKVHWVQEEHRNMGPYRFVQANMLDRFGVNPQFIGRGDSSTTAVGSTKAHERQAAAIIAEVFAETTRPEAVVAGETSEESKSDGGERLDDPSESAPSGRSASKAPRARKSTAFKSA